MASTTVRVSDRTREAIGRLSRKRGVSAAELLEELVARFEEDELLAAMNDAYAAVRSDPEQWRALKAERELWDATLLDGLSAL